MDLRLPGTKVSFINASIIFIIGAISFLAPALFFPSTSPIDSTAVAMNVFVLVLVIYTSYRGQTVVAFFNSVCLFFVTYPFLVQSAQGIGLSSSGYFTPLNWQVAVIYCLYLLIITVVATRHSVRPHAKYTQYDSNPRNILIVYSFAVLFLFIWGFGQESILSTRLDQYLNRDKAQGATIFLRDTLRITPFWLAYIAVVSSRNRTRKHPFSAAYFICLAVGLILANPVNAARFYSLSAILVAILPVLSHFNLTQRLPVVFPALMVVILPVSSSLRYGLADLTWSEAMSIFYSLEFSALQVLNDGFQYLDYFEWGYGHYTASALLIFVPRSVWPSKNEGTGSLIGESASYPISNVSVSPHFDAYLDFGIVGVIAFAVSVGYVFRKAYFGFGDGTRVGNIRADTYALLIALVPILARGDFGLFMLAFYSFFGSYVFARMLVGIGSVVSFRRTSYA